jgi:hypothetical protein
MVVVVVVVVVVVEFMLSGHLQTLSVTRHKEIR